MRGVRKERITVYLPVEVAKKIKQIAVEKRKRYSAVIEEALRAYIQKWEEKRAEEKGA